MIYKTINNNEFANWIENSDTEEPRKGGVELWK